jgi:excisionase family DNA binding protein
MKKPPDDLLRAYPLDVVAERLSVSRRTLVRAVDLGHLHVIRVGRAMRVTEAELRRVIADGLNTGYYR